MQRWLSRLEGARALDGFADRLFRAVRATVARGALGDALHGRQIGHPLHPAAVQFPVGAWTSTAVLDALPGTRHPATVLLAVGTAGAIPATVTGLAEFGTLSPEQRRVAVVHATADTVALGLFSASLVARLKGRHGRGRALTLAGLGVAGIGAYIGGHLAFAQSAGTNHAAAELSLVPEGWHSLGAVAGIAAGAMEARMIGRTPVVVYRDGDDFSVLIGRCAHDNGPLTDGKEIDVDGDKCVECPWHGSVFRLADGRALRGPAGSDQVVLRTRVRDGRLEARRP